MEAQFREIAGHADQSPFDSEQDEPADKIIFRRLPIASRKLFSCKLGEGISLNRDTLAVRHEMRLPSCAADSYANVRVFVAAHSNVEPSNSFDSFAPEHHGVARGKWSRA